MENEYLTLVKEEFVNDFDHGKNYLAIREIIRAAGSNYQKETGQSEFDYYLQNLQEVDPLRIFQDDWSVGLFSEAMLVLIRNNTKCEAILHYIVDHKNIKMQDDHIVEACKSYESLAFKLIKNGANVHHVKFYNRYSTLHAAALAGFTNLVEYLLKCKVNPNARTINKENALHYACINGNLDVVKLLIETNINLYHCQATTLRTPIEIAIVTDNLDVTLLILKSKISDNLKFDLVFGIFICLCNHNFVIIDSTALAIFELVWEKLVKTFLASTRGSRERSILNIFLNNKIFRSTTWFSAIKIILTSSIASKLLEEFAALNGQDLIALMVTMFDIVGVEKENRMEIIEVLLSLDVKPSLQDLASTLFYFKNREEFDLLSLHLLYDYKEEKHIMPYVASVFCGLHHQLDFRKVLMIEKDVYNYVTQYFTDDNKMINTASLKELSRNATRKLIIENAENVSPKYFMDSVNSLKIPILLKHFIMLKIPLDEF